MHPVIKSFFNFTLKDSIIPEKDLELLLPYITVHELKKKEQISLKDGLNNSLLFIHSGLFKMSQSDGNRTVILGFLQETDFYLDFESTLKKCESLTTVECLESSEYISIPYDKLLEAYDQSHPLERFGRHMVERAFMDYASMTSIAKLPQPIDRYQAFEKERPDLTSRLPLKVLAGFIGITPESLSRIRKRRVS